MRKTLLYLFGISAGIGILLALVWPYIQREMMREPIMNAVDAVRAGDSDTLVKCFTAGAQVAYSDSGIADERVITLPIRDVVTLLEPHMQNGQLRGMATVGELQNITQVTNDVVGADVTITFYVDGGDEIPYRNIPYKRSGHFELKRMSLLTYKIQGISTNARDFHRRMQ